MLKDERDVLEVLKSELEFLEQRGYQRSAATAWRAKYIFEDSPSCVNYNSSDANRRPCTDCALIYLVPPAHRSSKSPCRHIPFNEAGETLDSLYRYADQTEIEKTVAGWLHGAIKHLDGERKVVLTASGESSSRGIPLYSKQHPKCANPACPATFHWTVGGKFFRFRPDVDSARESNSTGDNREGIHGVKHYWLCERCAQVFTLVHDEECGVMIKLLWPEITAKSAAGAVTAQKAAAV
jgi:hypothetical protein